MLKSQDVIVLLKLIASCGYDWKQSNLALHLCMSVATVNESLHRLVKSNLIIQTDNHKFMCIKANCIEFLISCVHYIFPGKHHDIPIKIQLRFQNIEDNLYTTYEWPYEKLPTTFFVITLFHSLHKSMVIHPDVTFANLIFTIDKLRDCNTSIDDKKVIAAELKELLDDAFSIRDSRMNVT